MKIFKNTSRYTQYFAFVHYRGGTMLKMDLSNSHRTYIIRFRTQPEWPLFGSNSAVNHIGAPIGSPIIAIIVMKKPKNNLIKSLNGFDMIFLLYYCLLFRFESKTTSNTSCFFFDGCPSHKKSACILGYCLFGLV